MERIITQPTTADHPEMKALWEASVRATHRFLNEQDIEHIKTLLTDAFNSVSLYVIKDGATIAGMMGLTDDQIAMLFIHPNYFNQGIGTQLMSFAINEYNLRKVEVNVQNPNAIGFYKHLGFKIVGRRETDDQGQPFPILEMELEPFTI